MDVSDWSRKKVGDFGERAAAEYLRRQGMRLKERNVARKTGELDLVCESREPEGRTLHFVEVKTIVTDEFPDGAPADEYDPSLNLHEGKIRRVARTAEWYVAETGWEGDWQVDGCLVWIRRRDGFIRVRFLPNIV